MEWEVGIPGKAGVRRDHIYGFLLADFLFVQTPWEGGVYKLVMLFPEGKSLASTIVFTRLITELCLAEYPSKPPKCSSDVSIP